MAETKNRLVDVLKDFTTAMVVTSAQGKMRARPMAVVQIEDAGDALFVTSLDSPKVDEIEMNPRVLLTFQGSWRFASLSGEAEIIRDPALVEKHWKEDWRLWFPEGKSDPRICFIRVHGSDAEYWDSAGGNAVTFAFEAARAYLSGTEAKRNDKLNAKVQVPKS